jgi:ubiquinone/menaquinone biosynthesis C-methylase UbiE
MSLYAQCIAALYDRWYEPAESAGLSELRTQQLASAAGTVLEIGAGTGLNLPHYPPSVELLTLTEPDRAMMRRLAPKLLDTSLRTSVAISPAERLPCPDASVDVVACTFVLCTTPSPGRALREIRRVLKPGGRLLFFEHVRADEPRQRRLQDRLAPAWRRVSYGCHCNRPTLDTIQASGFEIAALQTGDLPKAPALWRPYVLGQAVPN